MLGTVALDQQACLFKLHVASVHVCSCTRPAAQPSLQTGKQTFLPLRMFDYVAHVKHTFLKPISFFCDTCTRLTGLLQHPYL